MTKRIAFPCLGLLLIVLGLSGCFGGGGGGGASPKGTVTGYVSEVDTSTPLRIELTFMGSSPGVAGATVTLVGTNKVAQTTNVGKFNLSNISPGTYDLAIQKIGWPSVKVYGVTVEASKTKELALRMVKPGQTAPPETIAPTVSINCPSTVSGSADISITANDASGIFGVALFMDENQEPIQGWGFDGSTIASSLTWTWDTITPPNPDSYGIGWHNGEHTLTVMALDNNHNAAFRSITVNVNNPTEGGDLPTAPTNLTAMMVTAHYSVFSTPTPFGPMVRGMKSQKRLGIFDVSGIKSRIGTKGTPAGSDSIIICSLDWNYGSPNVLGFKVYRDGVCIGDVPNNRSPWPDSSPKLSPGQKVEYKVSGYNRSGEGPKSASVQRTPLSPLRGVALVSPADGNSTSSTPTFSWGSVPGAEGYLIEVMDAAHNSMWAGYTRGETSVTYGDSNHTIGSQAQPLTSGVQYTWYVMAAATTPDIPDNPNWDTWQPDAVSISASEEWAFTVGPQ
ncbi:MAG: carboxypeptidase regulatory-like domain-containing protein [Firmicutes bacterium]|nr:carboxypeptidase regulatory-like domain-containing protein [Bacillota bacterium]